MNSKVLTISIAAYNVEKYIKDTLDSVLIDEVLKDIEVIVIDDGSTDNTSKIIDEYESKYKDVLRVIHKENGGYGSTVNASIGNANGKYFKLLDGDDLFDKEGLINLVSDLIVIDVDVFITGFTKRFIDNNDKVKKENNAIYFSSDNYNNIIPINNFNYKNGIPMHAITYKTSLLKESKIVLPEHILYTDNYYAAIPFAYAKDLYIAKYNVYRYSIGVNGQSINIEKKIEKVNQLYRICIDLVNIYEDFRIKNMSSNYLANRVSATLSDYFAILIQLDVSRNSYNRIIEFENVIKNISNDIYKTMITLDRKSSMINKYVRKYGYLIYCIISVLTKFLYKN